MRKKFKRNLLASTGVTLAGNVEIDLFNLCEIFFFHEYRRELIEKVMFVEKFIFFKKLC